jgi:hypothetical protein
LQAIAKPAQIAASARKRARPVCTNSTLPSRVAVMKQVMNGSEI